MKREDNELINLAVIICLFLSITCLLVALAILYNYIIPLDQTTGEVLDTRAISLILIFTSIIFAYLSRLIGNNIAKIRKNEDISILSSFSKDKINT